MAMDAQVKCVYKHLIFISDTLIIATATLWTHRYKERQRQTERERERFNKNHHKNVRNISGFQMVFKQTNKLCVNALRQTKQQQQNETAIAENSESLCIHVMHT